MGTGAITLNDVAGGRGYLQNFEEEAILNNDLIISANGGRLKAGWESQLNVTGVVSGAGLLSIEGDNGTNFLSGTANTFTGNIDLLAANSRLRVASLGTAGTYSGNVSGLGIFDYAFPTTPTLDGTYTHTGGTAISLVTVEVNDFPMLNCFNGGQDIILAEGGTLDVQGTVIANNFLNPEGGSLINNGSAVDYSSNSFTSNGGTFTVDGTGDVILGEMNRTAGNPTVIKEGSSTLTLAGVADNVSFRAEVNDGTLLLAKASTGSVHAIGGLLTVNGGVARLGGTGDDQIFIGSTVTLNGGTFDLDTHNERIKFLNLFGGDITGTGVLTVNSSGGPGFIDAQSGTVAPSLAGNVNLTKSTSGTVTLSGAGNYSGNTTINEGTLVLGPSTDLADGADVFINGGTSVLQLANGVTDVVNELWIDGVPVAMGTWGHSSSTAVNTDDIHFSGTGVLSVSTTGPTYDSWAFANVGGQTPNEDFNSDGVQNGIAYFMNDTGVISLPGIVGGTVT